MDTLTFVAGDVCGSPHSGPKTRRWPSGTAGNVFRKMMSGNDNQWDDARHHEDDAAPNGAYAAVGHEYQDK